MASLNTAGFSARTARPEGHVAVHKSIFTYTPHKLQKCKENIFIYLNIIFKTSIIQSAQTKETYLKLAKLVVYHHGNSISNEVAVLLLVADSDVAHIVLV